MSTARKWFDRKSGLAGGILTSAFYFGSGLISPFMTASASILDWRATALIYAFSAGFIIMFLAFFVIRNTPESMGLSLDGQTPSPEIRHAARRQAETDSPIQYAIGTFSFWMIFLAYSLIGIPGQGLLGHVVLWGTELGAPVATSGLFLTGYTFGCGVTGIFGGFLADVIGKRVVLFTAYSLSGLVLVVAWMFTKSPWGLMILVVLFGLFYGTAAGPGLWAAYVGDLFGRALVGRLLGIMTLGYGFVGGLGPLIWGKIHDLTGRYNNACLFSAFCFLAIIICVSLARPVTKMDGLFPARPSAEQH